ncbi:MAG: hypothetical protein ACLP0J_23665 [Solirubrobacteraceae bacterium]
MPGEERRFRFEEDVRLALLAEWWPAEPTQGVPPELQAFSARLLEILTRRDAGPDELLEPLLFANPIEALRSFDELFNKADKRFDLVQCRRLLDLLEPLARFSADAEARRDLCRAHLNARRLWIDDWYSTLTALVPKSNEAALDRLLAGNPSRILQVRGYSGYGKTTHVRWFISRKCVEDWIPCARVDFDDIDPYVAAQEPHLVLLEMAAQLGLQLPDRGFGKLARDYDADRRRLRRDRRRSTQAVSGDQAPASDYASGASLEEIAERLLAELAELPAETPVAFVLDTLEVPLHLQRTDRGAALTPLFELLGQALKRAPSIRLVLSGRYRISEEVRLEEVLGHGCPELVLPVFTPDESRTYLTDRRQITSLSLVDAAAKASGGVPFSLALLADLIDTDPDITPRTIGRYRGAEYAYLIERVVKRIPEQQVRWLLRYAAIPRRFDREFAAEVLWPWVLRVRSGNFADDDPDDDDAEYGHHEHEVWTHGEDVTTFDDAWSLLIRYVSGQSWIFADDVNPGLLRLQTEVVRPMRKLLSARPIVAKIHSDAANYFELRAREEEGFHRLTFVREAVFHRFALDPDTAMGWWWTQLRHAADAPAERAALADELIRGPREASGDERDPRLSAREQQARLELCLASSEIAMSDDVRPQRLALRSERAAARNKDALLAIDTLTALERGDTTEISPARVALARAAVTLARGAIASDGDMSNALDAVDVSDRERLWITVAQTHRLIDSGSPTAEDCITTARQLAERVDGQRWLKRDLALAVVDYHVRICRFKEALDECQHAIDSGLGLGDFGLQKALLHLRAGNTCSAKRTAAVVAADIPALLAEARLIEAMAHVQRKRAESALDRAEEALDAISDQPDGSRTRGWVQGRAQLQIARSYGSLLRVEEARSVLAMAVRTLESISDRETVALCNNEEARLLLRDLGQLAAAGVALDHAERAAPEGGRAAKDAVLLRALLAERLGQTHVTADLLKSASGSDPVSRARIAITGLTVGRRNDRAHYLAELGDALAEVSPPTARLELLGGIEQSDLVLGRAFDRKRLRAAIPDDGWDPEFQELGALDRGVLRMRAAALAALADGPVLELLEEAVGELEDGGAAVPLWLEARRIARAARLKDLATRAGGRAVELAQSDPLSTPLMRCTAVVEHLEAELEARAPSEAERNMLLRAAEDLEVANQSLAEAWSARLQLLLARAEGSSPDAGGARVDRAIRLYEAAGDVANARRLLPRDQSEQPPDRNGDLAEVELSFSDGHVSTRPRRPWYRRLFPSPTGQAVRRHYLQWWTDAGAEPYPPGLTDLILTDMAAFRTELGELAGTPMMRLTKPAPRMTELAIRVQDGALQPLPWELASGLGGERVVAADLHRLYRAAAHTSPDPRVPRFLQSALNLVYGSGLVVDGVVGPDTQGALNRLTMPAPAATPPTPRETFRRLLAARLEGTTPSVVIVRRPIERRRRALALQRRYAYLGFQTIPVERSHARQLRELLRADPPPVIVHVVGGLVETGGAVAIAVAEPSQGKDEGLLGASDVDRAFRSAASDWPAPILILDVPAPSGQRETVSQLLLRNALAADIFALGGARTVIGTGLAKPASEEEVLGDVLISGLARGIAVGDVVQLVRHEASADGKSPFAEVVAFEAIALWADDPDVFLLPTRSS